MPVRNGARFIIEALNSVLVQLASDDEIIIVDDSSTDATPSILTDLCNPRVRVLIAAGRGVSAARNAGLAAANGRFIAFLDHDDLWPQGRHQAMLHALIEDTHLDAVFGRIQIRLESDGIWWPWMQHQDGRFAPGSNLGNALFRRTALERLDGFDESIQVGEDIDYFNRLQRTGLKLALCDVDALIYRRHANNITNDHGAMKNFIFDLIRRHRNRICDTKSDLQNEKQ